MTPRSGAAPSRLRRRPPRATTMGRCELGPRCFGPGPPWISPPTNALAAAAGISPSTRVSGRLHYVVFRRGCNHRLRQTLVDFADGSRPPTPEPRTSTPEPAGTTTPRRAGPRLALDHLALPATRPRLRPRPPSCRAARPHPTSAATGAGRTRPGVLTSPGVVSDNGWHQPRAEDGGTLPRRERPAPSCTQHRAASQRPLPASARDLCIPICIRIVAAWPRSEL